MFTVIDKYDLPTFVKEYPECRSTILNALLSEHEDALETYEDYLEEYCGESGQDAQEISYIIRNNIEMDLQSLGYYDFENDKWYDDGSFDPDEN